MLKRHITLLATSLLIAAPLTAGTGDHGHEQTAAWARFAMHKADHMAREVLETTGFHQDECTQTAGLAAEAQILDLRGSLALAVASCINEESATILKFFECLQESFAEYHEGLEELQSIHAARLDLCSMTGGGIYDPDLDEDAFVEGVDHTFAPFKTGATWVYQGMTDEGLEEITVTVTGDTIDVDDIECIVVRDVVTLDGVMIEDTSDWYAQHEDGTVWYLGEIAQNFEDGMLTDLDGSWRTGDDGALPGIIMPATPVVGQTYRQELLLTEAEDAGTVLATDATAIIGIGTYTNCLQTADFTPIEPGVLEHKYYAPGVGLVLEEKPGTGERVELISFTPGS